MSELGAIFYRGPSLLTGEPIVGALSGLEGGSMNAKTGPMVQAWILRADRPPMDAVRDGSDAAICGDCKLRGEGGRQRRCYVTPWLGPLNVWKMLDRYLEPTWADLQALVEGRTIRLGAYGDPAAIPFEVWRMLLAGGAGWVAYTHAWRSCDPRFKSIAMASVDTEHEFRVAHLAGWRTFRVRMPDAPLLGIDVRRSGIGKIRPVDKRYRQPLEFVCPASDEAGHRTTCQRCQLCRGTSSPARSVAIAAHGKPSTLQAYGLRPARWFGHTTSTAEVSI